MAFSATAYLCFPDTKYGLIVILFDQKSFEVLNDFRRNVYAQHTSILLLRFSAEKPPPCGGGLIFRSYQALVYSVRLMISSCTPL